MAVPIKVATRTQTVIKELQEAENIPLPMKDSLIDIMCEARDGTNGLSEQEKVQSNSETIANLTFLFISHILSMPEQKKRTRLDIIAECRWQIVIIAIAVCGLLAFRPQLASIIDRASGTVAPQHQSVIP